jgi:Glycogen recognition site of AMP-activated protein kinase
MSRHSIAWTVVPLIAATIVRPLRAQAVGQLQVAAGSATDERGVRSNAVTLSPSLTFGEGGAAKAAVAGVATFFQDNAWALGGIVGANSRAPISGGFGIALAADGTGSRTSYGATFATAELSPTVEWTGGPITLFGGGRVAGGYTAIAAQPSFGALGGTTSLVSRTRALYAPVYGARVRLLGEDPSVGAELAVRDEPMHVGDTLVVDQTVNAAAVLGPVTLSGSVGHRSAPGERLTFGSGSFALDLAHGMALAVGGGRYPSNRLTGAAAGNYVTVGLSLRVGGGEHRALPMPRGIGPAPAGVTRLTIRAPEAQSVEVAGDWDDWTPVPAERADNGVWYADLRIPPGEYRYAFRIDGHAWRVPGGAVAVDDGFGGKAAYVTVRDAGASDTPVRQEDR